MREQPYDGLTLYGPRGNRKYLNSEERQHFVEAASGAPATPGTSATASVFRPLRRKSPSRLFNAGSAIHNGPI